MVSYGDVISRYIDCFDQSGNNPAYILPGHPQTSTASCPTGYKVTSCGAKAINIDHEDDILGAYINGNGCEAETRWSCVPPFCEINEGGIRVYARCCNLNDYTSSFKTYTSSKSGSNDDDEATVSCSSSTEKLIGCTGYSSGGSGATQYDGSLIGDESSYLVTGPVNTCRARNGAKGDGVYANAICYDKSTINDGYQLDCIVVWGSLDYTSSVSCPTDHNDYFMTSCNGHSFWSEILEYVVENNICKYGGKTIGVASAMCCRMYKHTPNPTLSPTRNPTISPTQSTQNPTNGPTNNNPTTDPTNDPTFDPTYEPTTNDPTNDPTYDPTIDPTTDPSSNPTMSPTKKPTYRPTIKGVQHIQPTYAMDRAVTTNITIYSSIYIKQDDRYDRETSSAAGIIIAMVILGSVFCCGCMILWTWKYFISKKDNKHKIIMEMSRITSVSDFISDMNVKEATIVDSCASIKDTYDNNIMDGEFVIEDDDDDDDILTPRVPRMDDKENLTIVGDDGNEVIGSDDDETPGTENDETNESEEGNIFIPDGDVVISTSDDDDDEITIDGYKDKITDHDQQLENIKL